MTPGPITEGSVGSPRPRVQDASALVIGLDTWVGLLTSRTLARRGVRVVGLAADRHHPSCWTNTCSRLVIAPTAGPRLLDELEALAGPEAGAVLFPCTDAAVNTLVHAPDRLRAFRPVLPSAEVVEELTDRRRFARSARAAGIAVPASMLVSDPQSAARAARTLRFPCALTPVPDPPGRTDAVATRHYAHAAAMLEDVDALLRRYTALFVQERALQTATRERYACSCYISPRGLPILTFVSRHLRKPHDALGLWSVDEAIVDPTVRELAMAVMSSVAFVGLGTIEAERDPVSGDLRVLHVTVGRPSHRSTMAETGGVELLYTMYRDAIGASLPVDRRQHDRPATRVRYLGSLRTSLRAGRDGRLTPSAWMRSLRGPHPPISLDLDDPLPSVAAGVGRVWRRLGRPGRHEPTPRSSGPPAPTVAGSGPDPRRIGA